MCDTCKLKNGHVVYCTADDVHKYPAFRQNVTLRIDVETTWESIVYVAGLAYDARDVAGLFFDGVTVAVLNHYDVPLPAVALIGGIIMGIVVLHKHHKQKNE